MKFVFTQPELAYIGPFLREMGKNLQAPRNDRRKILKLSAKFTSTATYVELSADEQDLILRILKPSKLFFDKKIQALSGGFFRRLKYRREIKKMRTVRALLFQAILRIEDYDDAQTNNTDAR